jgi:D-xylose transport system substrate-binding protein
MNKPLVKIFVLILGIYLTFSCKSENTKFKVGFLMRNQTMERCKQEKVFFSEKIAQLGGEVIFYDANDDENKQLDQGHEVLKQDIDVLVIFPMNLSTCAATVREANDKNVKVIAYESLIQGCKLNYYISADNGKGGALMADYMVKLVPQGNYVILGGDKADRNAVLIKTAQEKVILPLTTQGKIKVLYNIYADWTPDEGYRETKRVLELSGITPDAIVGANDGLAKGIINALQEYGLAGKIPVTGLDAELSACQRVAKGTQTLTIFKSFKKQAYAAAEMAMQIATGKKVENINAKIFNGAVDVPTYLIDPVLVDKNNLREVIVKGGIYSEQDVYGNN